MHGNESSLWASMDQKNSTKKIRLHLTLKDRVVLGGGEEIMEDEGTCSIIYGQ